MAQDDSAFARRIAGLLVPLLGPHTTERALDLISRKVGVGRDALGPADLEATSKVLRPMLRTLVGDAVTTEVLSTLAEGDAS
jgi:hypothetical protein